MPIRPLSALILAAACALPLAAADGPAPIGEAAPATTAPAIAADAAVRGWLASAKAGDYAPIAGAIPADLRRMVTPPAAPAADAGNGNPGRGMGRMRGGLLGRLSSLDEAGAAEVAGQLAQMLTSIGDLAAGTATQPQFQAGQDPAATMQAMAPRFMANGVIGGLPRAILAEGLETRQIAALAGFWKAHAAFASTTDLSAVATKAEVAKRLLAFGASLKEAAPPEESEAGKASRGMAGIFHALAAFGLDGETALNGATVTTEGSSDKGTVVVIAFTAYGSQHKLPLKVLWKDNAWRIEADSPLNKWQGGGMMGGMPGGGFGGQGRGRRGQNGGGAQGNPPEAPATQPQGF